MKKQLLLCFYLIVPLAIFPLLPVQSYAQEQVNDNLVKYKFTVQDVNNAASAKEMTDYIRPLFNSEEKPFEFFPWFNAVNSQFEFESSIRVSESELYTVLDHYGLVLISFSSVLNASANSTKQ